MAPFPRVRLFEVGHGIDRSRVERPRRHYPTGCGMGENGRAVAPGSRGG
jgi:hypothetical protein